MSRRAFATVPLWVGAGAVAVSVHFVLVQQGLAAYNARNVVPPPPVVLEIEIMAVASSVAGEDAPVKTVTAVAAESLPARTSADRADVSQPQTARKGAPSTAERLVGAASREPAPANAAARVALTPPATTVTPARPRPASVLAARSSANAVKPAPPAPGLTAPAIAPVAVGPETRHAPTATAQTPLAGVSAVGPVARASSTAPASAATPVAPLQAAPRKVIAAVAAVPRQNPDAIRPVASLPPPAEVKAQEGVGAPQPAQTPQENLLTYRSVLDILATMPKSPCFAALPSLSDESVFQLEVFAQTPAALADFAQGLTRRVGQMPNSTMKAISAAQCGAADFISEGPAYPRSKLFFDIPVREIKSGEALEGRIGNTSGGFISFFLIDDEGTVQDLAGFLQFRSGEARFRIPMSLTGKPVVTQQLLMAISSPSLLQSVIAMNGASSDTFFAALTAELREKAHSEDVALVAFSVE